MKKNTLVLGVLLGLVSSGIYAESVDKNKQGFPYIYSVKFICGLQINPSGSANLPLPAEPPVKPGNYATSVNVHNYHFNQTYIFNKVTLAGGKISPIVNVVLTPNQSITIDCAQIARALLSTGGTLPSFIEGFVELSSRDQLSVAAVYTSQSCYNPGAGRCTQLGELSLEVVPQPVYRG